MNLFSEFIVNFSNRTVRVSIDHEIYGNQKATIRNFRPFCTEDRVGFFINEREVFVYFDEIENIQLSENAFIINGTLQKIAVKIV